MIEALMGGVITTAITGVFVLRVPADRRGGLSGYRWAMVVLFGLIAIHLLGSADRRAQPYDQPTRPAATPGIEAKSRALEGLFRNYRPEENREKGARVATVSNWEIGRLAAADAGCFAGRTAASGGIVLSLSRVAGLGHVAIANERWTAVIDGKIYPITMRLDARRGWSIEGRGRIFPEKNQGGFIRMSFDNTEFLADLVKGGELSLAHVGCEIGSFSLSPDVGQALLRCRASVMPPALQPAGNFPARD